MPLNLPASLKLHLASTLAPMLLKLGARKVSDIHDEYKINTRIGEMFIAIYDDWVHCCFENVQAAKDYFHVNTINQHRLNPNSGKWNWHWFDVNPNVIEPLIYKMGKKKAHLNLLAEVVWREIEDLT